MNKYRGKTLDEWKEYIKEDNVIGIRAMKYISVLEEIIFELQHPLNNGNLGINIHPELSDVSPVVSDSLVGKECFYVDRTTFGKKLDGKPLGICISEGIDSLHKQPIVWFEKGFLGSVWQYRTNVRCEP